jgi:hypothetical protein
MEVEVDVADLGLVTTPMAKPPITPAKTPIKAKTSVLSTKVAFPRLDIAFRPPFLAFWSCRLILPCPAGSTKANCRQAP